MPFDGSTQTGTPPTEQVAQPPILIGGSPWSQHTQTEINGASFAAAAAGTGTITQNSAGGEEVVSRASSGHWYAQCLWTIPVAAMRATVSGPVPPDLVAAESNPRYFGYTWETAPAVVGVHWSPLLHEDVHAAGSGTATTELAALIAHGLVLAYWTGSVDTSGTHPKTGFVAAGSLPAGWAWAPAVADFIQENDFGGFTDWSTNSYTLPDLAAGEGVEIPVTDYETLTACYALLYPDWQTVSSGPGSGNEFMSFAHPNTSVDPVADLVVAWGPADYHYSFYNVPTAPAPVTLDAAGHVTWAASVSEQFGSIDHYVVQYIDTGVGVLFEYTVAGTDTSFTITDWAPVSGRGYLARVIPYDAPTLPGTSADSDVYSPGVANGDPKIELAVVALARAAAAVLPRVSTEPEPLP